MVVRLPLDDGTGTIQLLGENHPHHLVGEGHLGEGNLFITTLIHS